MSEGLRDKLRPVPEDVHHMHQLLHHAMWPRRMEESSIISGRNNPHIPNTSNKTPDAMITRFRFVAASTKESTTRANC